MLCTTRDKRCQEKARERERMQTCGPPSSARTGDRKALLPATGMGNLPTYLPTYLATYGGALVARSRPQSL